MVDLEFDSNTLGVNNIKLSAIFEADNFVYSTFDQDNNMLSFNRGLPYTEFDTVINTINPVTTKVAVKTPFFGHFGDQERIPMEGQFFIDKMTGQNIWCSYESPFTPKGVSIKHFSTLLNHEFYLDHRPIFHIHFDEDLFHIYVQNNGELMLYNCYKMDGEGDLLYYHSLISQALDLNVEFNTLRLSGMIEHYSKAYTQLSPFHNHIEFVNSPDVNIITTREDLKPYHFYDHIINLKCGL